MMHFLVGRTGFEPVKAQGQQIYSLPRLTASVPTRVANYVANQNASEFAF